MNGMAAMSDPMVREAGRRLLRARAERAHAKAHLHETLDKIEYHMSPEGLADDAGRAIQVKIAQVGRKGVETVRERPITLAAGAGAIMAVLAHRPIWEGAKKLFDRLRPAAAH